MSQFILVTESGADLPQKYIDRFNIKIVPMYVNFGENTFKDSDIKAEDVFDYYEKNKILPTTSGSTPNDFTEIFRNINETYLDAEIISISPIPQ